jgi:uncharacterized protein (DUF1697 family)
MTNLRNFLTELGFENVRSVLQTGNLVFESRSRFGAELDSKHLVVLFLKNPPTPKDVAALQADILGAEVVKAKGKQAYIFYPDGIGRSKLTNAMIEKRIGRGTGRNWNTVLKLDVIAKAGSLRLTPVTQRKRIV